MKKAKVTIKLGSVEEFFDRVRSNAEKLDRGKVLPATTTIMFEDPQELLSVLTSERIRLLRWTKAALPLSDLASGLKRDIKAVGRDVTVLEKAGLLRTTYKANPGHGRHKIVEPVAQHINLTASLF